MDIRTRLEAHAAACREAMAVGKARPSLPQDIADELWRMVCHGERANLVGASLDCARLNGASLNGASLDGASLVGASLDGVSLDGVSLNGASLDGVSLDGARLAGASLDGATLRLTGGAEAKLTAGEVRTLTGGRYHAFTVPSDRGRLLRFGCVTLPITEWRTKLPDLCAKHEPGRVEHYVAEIGALLDWCESLDRVGVRA